MLTYTPTLPAGPYDWDDVVLPMTEFSARVAAIREVMAQRGVSTLAVYGSTFEHSALTYLTNFVPKIGFAIAFLPARGDARIIFSLGANMQPAFRRLTWIESVEPMGNVGAQLAKQFAAIAASPDGFALGLWGTSGMPTRIHREILDAAAALGPVTDLDAALHHLLRGKSVCEKSLLRRSATILSGAFDQLRSGMAAGLGRRSIALGVERQAFRLGAQDVRVLVSARHGGPPLCIDDAQDLRIDPLNAYIAVRVRGYWTEGQTSVASAPKPAYERAKAALAAGLDVLRPGAAATTLVQRIDAALLPYRRSAEIAPIVTGYTGLSLDESILGGDPSSLSPGDMCLVRVAAVDDTNQLALASALVEIGGSEAGGPTFYFVSG
jgi:hypothetical protein